VTYNAGVVFLWNRLYKGASWEACVEIVVKSRGSLDVLRKKST
jgi:hypothetical protein